jgi:hypothetical protein
MSAMTVTQELVTAIDSEDLVALEIELSKMAPCLVVGGRGLWTPDNAEDWFGPAAYASKHGKLAALRKMVELKVPVILDFYNADACSLMSATKASKHNVVSFLLDFLNAEMRRDAGIKWNDYSRLLEVVARGGDIEMLKLYMAHCHGPGAFSMVQSIAACKHDSAMLSMLYGEYGASTFHKHERVDRARLLSRGSYSTLHNIIITRRRSVLYLHDSLVRTLEVQVSFCGCAQFHWCQFRASRVEPSTNSIGGLPFVEPFTKENLELPDPYYQRLERVVLVSAYTLIEVFYQAVCRENHAIKHAYRRLLFRSLHKARRLWVKAINHVRYPQKLLREAEAFEIKHERARHFPGGDLHASSMAGCGLTLKRLREEE